MVLRAKGGEIRRHQQRIKQSIKGGGGASNHSKYTHLSGGMRRIWMFVLADFPIPDNGSVSVENRSQHFYVQNFRAGKVCSGKFGNIDSYSVLSP